MSPEEKVDGWETVVGEEPYDVEPFGKQKRWMKGRYKKEMITVMLIQAILTASPC